MPVEDVRPDGPLPSSPIHEAAFHSRASSPRNAKRSGTDVAQYVDTSALAKLVVAEPPTRPRCYRERHQRHRTHVVNCAGCREPWPKTSGFPKL